ncbi:MAG: efflux transporter outer membrane subunit [Chlamydiia bacterium]|nr:efflux transporter outer membrane subunit [Chlamydiia bacterium]
MYPKYERPSFCDEVAWRTPLSTENSIDEKWWNQFEDPVLNDLIKEALANNQDLKTAIARVDQYLAMLTVARSQFYPQFSTDAFSSRQKISSSATALPSGIQPVFNLFGLILKASYLVDIWGEVRSGVEAAYHMSLSSIETRRSVVLGLVSAVASSYVQLRQLDHQLKVSEETLKTREQSLHLANVRFELGLTSQIQVEQAISEVEQAVLKVEEYQLGIAETENQISVLLGSPSRSIPRGKTLDQERMPPSIPPFLPSDLLDQRPDVRAAEERLIALNANIGVAKAQFFPQIRFDSTVGAESVSLNQLFTNPSKIWSFGSDLLQQIFTGFALTGNLEEARAEKEEALSSYFSTILNAFKEANNALTSHKIYLEEVETQRIRVEALKKYLYLANLRYQEGETDYLTFLDAERHLFEGLLDYESAKGNSFLSYIQIYQAFGGSWVCQADDEALSRFKSPLTVD